LKRVTLTVEYMKSLLEKQVNRTPSQTRIQSLAAEMKFGKWNPNIAPILLYPNGTLADGQHRIAAAVLCNKPLTAFVGVIEWGEITKVDAGKARTAFNHAQILGYSVNNSDIAAARVALLLEQRTYSLVMNISHEALLQATERFPVCKYRHRHAVVAGACAYLDTISGGVRDFHHQVVTGEMLTRTDPAFHLRNAMMVVTGGKASREELLVKTVRAWNAYANGESMSILRAGKRPFEWIDICRKEAKDGQPAPE
jgi:hypothetical protein